ncbi:hypothetical protein [Krasilnikovia sp. M28-CT-15]|uniref:hypothetical protein n=1 Tax=Krasilnikovia sp. M28-CT-15 TaxID=3373540 RepID=UPI003876DD18
MIVILGLLLLAAAAIIGVAGVLGNAGEAHALSDGFSVFGYPVTGSTGELFLYGIVVGAVAAFGLSMLLAGARRTSRRGSVARSGLKQSRRETAAANAARDDLIKQRETAAANAARDDLIKQRETAAAKAARDDLIKQRETARELPAEHAQ